MSNILLYTHELSYTGAPTSLLRICKVLLQNNYLVDLWSKSNGNYRQEFEILGVNVKIVPDKEIPYHIEEIKKYDLAIANTIVSYKFYDECRKFIPTIWYIREAQNIKSILGQNEYWEGVFRSADKLYCVSEYAADYICKNYNKNVEVIHNCVEDQYIPRDTEKDDSAINLLMLGSLTERKAFIDLIDAYEKLNELEQSKFTIKFAGQIVLSQKSYADKLLNKIEKYKNIEYLGEITDKKEIIYAYRDADIVVVPSIDESCSLVVLEAAMMSKALVVSENVGAKYLISEENGWIFETSNIVNLAEVLRQIIEKRVVLKTMGEVSRLKYLKDANMQIYERRICDLVLNAINKGISQEELERNRIISSQLINERLFKLEGIVKKKERKINEINWNSREHESAQNIFIERLKSENAALKSEIYTGYLTNNSNYAKKKKREIRIIRKSNFFDAKWYKSHYDNWIKFNTPEEHYYYQGWIIGNDPSPYFSSTFYLENNISVSINMCPLVHYELYGKKSESKIACSGIMQNILDNDEYKNGIINNSRYFDEHWYKKYYNLNDDTSPHQHYYSIGWRIGNNPSRKFCTSYYIQAYGNTYGNIENPLVHYETIGKRAGVTIVSSKKWCHELLRQKVKNKRKNLIILGLTADKDTIWHAYNYISSILIYEKEIDKIILDLSIPEFPHKMESLPRQLKELLGNKVNIIWSKNTTYINVFKNIKKAYPRAAIVVGRVDAECDIKWISCLLKKYMEKESAIYCCKGMSLYLDKENEIHISKKVNNESWFSIINHDNGVLYPSSFGREYSLITDEEHLWSEEFDVWMEAVKNHVDIVDLRLEDLKISTRENIDESHFNIFKIKKYSEYNLVREIINQREKEVVNYKKIKLIVPVNEQNKDYNGDYHYALAIQKSFEKEGYEVDFRFITDWYKYFDGKFVFVLRGPIMYECNDWNINIMWNISHPEMITISEYCSYNKVYIASTKWCEIVNRAFEKYKICCKAEVLLQCTDRDVFHRAGIKPFRDVLFVGMCHLEGRKVVNDLLPCTYRFSLYGPRWEKTVAYKYCQGNVIENKYLSKYYESAKIVLNDMRPDMMKRGFVSNRIYDAIASGSLIITEYSKDVIDIFGDAVVTYDGTREDLHNQIDVILENDQMRDTIIENGQRMIGNHTFDQRISKVIEYLLTDY